jgi:hypothetical protein
MAFSGGFRASGAALFMDILPIARVFRRLENAVPRFGDGKPRGPAILFVALPFRPSCARPAPPHGPLASQDRVADRGATCMCLRRQISSL